MRAETASIVTDLGPELRDGYEVHAAALRHGMDVVLYPRQVLMVSQPGSADELAFVHGVPETTRLGPATYAQDKRMRRALLERASLPVPKGTTFSVGRGVKGAKQFAAQIGYPVVIKPAIGDNAIETFADIMDVSEFDLAIDHLRVPPSERETYTRAAYGLTELREPGEVDGRIVVPPGYRFLVEKHVHGQYLRLLVLFGELHSVLHCSGSPSTTGVREAEEIQDGVHPSIGQVALDALAALPGVAIAAVDVVVTDYRLPASEQDHWIVEVSERPGLAVHAVVSARASAEVGDVILRRLAEQEGIELGAETAETAVNWKAEAVPDLASAIEAVNSYCTVNGLAGTVGEIDRIEGTIGGRLSGPAHAIARLSELLLDGQLQGQRAMLVEATQRN